MAMEAAAGNDDDRPSSPVLVPPSEYCPVSIGVALFGDRWSLLIVRELLAGATHFTEILWGLPGLSRALLSSRLRHLARMGVLSRTTASPGNRGGYRLTDAGEGLRPVIEAIGSWTLQWQFPPPSDDQCDPRLLLWRLAHGISRPEMPRPRACIEFRFSGHEPARGWIRLQGARSSVCFDYPEELPDLIVTATPAALTEVWYGHRPLASATRAGVIRIDGAPELVASFPRWFSRSPFAEMRLAMDELHEPSAGSRSELAL